MVWVLWIAALGIVALVAVDQRNRRAVQKQKAHQVRRYRIPAENWQALAEQMKDKRSEDPMQCSLREVDGVLRLFCATNEPYGLNWETVAFKATVKQELDTLELVLEDPEPLFKWSRSAVYSLSPRLDEYVIHKLSGKVLSA